MTEHNCIQETAAGTSTVSSSYVYVQPCDHKEEEDCKHKELKYCPKCGKVYCEKCKKEWGDYQTPYVPYVPYYPTYPIYPTWITFIGNTSE